jgi:predicted RNA-binding protein with EMAP domain
MMDYQILFNIAVAIAGFFGGWTLNRIYQAIDRLDNDVRNLPLNYVTRDDYRSDMSEIKHMLSKIFDRLENKADK